MQKEYRQTKEQLLIQLGLGSCQTGGLITVLLSLTGYATLKQLSMTGAFASEQIISRHLRKLIADGYVSDGTLTLKQADGKAVYRKVYSLTKRGHCYAKKIVGGTDLSRINCRSGYLEKGGAVKGYHSMGAISYLMNVLSDNAYQSVNFYHEKFELDSPASSAPMRPDGTCILKAAPDEPLCVYLETDLGTERTGAILDKYERYSMLLHTEAYLPRLWTIQICFLVDGTKYKDTSVPNTYYGLYQAEKKLVFPFCATEAAGTTLGKYLYPLLAQKKLPEDAMITEELYRELKTQANINDAYNRQQAEATAIWSYYYKRRRQLFFMDAEGLSASLTSLLRKGLSVTAMPAALIHDYIQVLQPGCYPSSVLTALVAEEAGCEPEEIRYLPNVAYGDLVMHNGFVYENPAARDAFVVLVENISDDLGGMVRCREFLTGATSLHSDTLLYMLCESEDDARNFVDTVQPSSSADYAFILYDNFRECLRTGAPIEPIFL